MRGAYGGAGVRLPAHRPPVGREACGGAGAGGGPGTVGWGRGGGGPERGTGGSGRVRRRTGGDRQLLGARTPVSAVTTGSRAWLISSPMERKKVMGAP